MPNDTALRWKLRAEAAGLKRRRDICTAAFRSPDGRTIPTEQIEPEIFWKLYDALEKTTARLAAQKLISLNRGKPHDYSMIHHTETAGDDAYALLSTLQLKRGD